MIDAKPFIPETGVDLRGAIASFIQDNTGIVNPDTGYIFCGPLNHTVDPGLIGEMVKVTIDRFINHLSEPPDLVIGVPARGKEFAFGLAGALHLPYGVSDRRETVNCQQGISAVYDLSSDATIIRGIESFTQPGIRFDHILRGVRPDTHTLLVADDFSAFGRVTSQYLSALEPLGISPVFAYMVAKDFPFLNPPQVGYRTHRENGVPVFAVVRVTNMIGGQGGTVIATAEDI